MSRRRANGALHTSSLTRSGKRVVLYTPHSLPHHRIERQERSVPLRFGLSQWGIAVAQSYAETGFNARRDVEQEDLRSLFTGRQTGVRNYFGAALKHQVLPIERLAVL